MTEIAEDTYLAHYGILRRSGRYPWGSGDTQDKRNKGFLDYVAEMKSKGMTETEIARGIGVPRSSLQAAKTIARNQQKAADVAMARRLKDKGMSNTAIAERMFGSRSKESSVRNLLADNASANADILQNITNMIREQLAKYGLIDIGGGVENHIGVSADRLNAAVHILKEEGYVVQKVKINQVGTQHETQVKVLAPPGTTQRDVFLNQDKIRQMDMVSADRGRTFDGFKTPISVNPNRIQIRYAEDGGAKEDGVMYIRPGVDDLSLGKNRYAQVRIQAGEDHYLKGMAIYRDDLPPGVDIVFNTNKKRANKGDKTDFDHALKPLKDDPDLPFGSIVDQIKDASGNVTSAANLVNEQGDWGGWSRTLSSQVLSKQQPALARRQLEVLRDQRRDEFDEIMSLTNPTVKRKLLEEFADSADSAAVHLKAAAIPRQNWHVIIPIPGLKSNEVFAPQYNDGEQVVLIRYPHGGTFEMPELVVNNRNRDARKVIGTDSQDAIGINHKVAERLSGADFDGDTVLVIPNGDGKIKTTPALAGLKNFDPQSAYPGYEGMPELTPAYKGKLMGDVSNLITDMTIKNASHEDIAAAVRHSMVVIDAEKHNLNWRQSEKDNGIRRLKEEYQGGARKGASTLISRKKGEDRVPQIRERRASEGGKIDPETGRRVYVETGATRKAKDGTRVPKTSRVNRLEMAEDAYALVSDARTPVERIYADHSNAMKGMANRARLEAAKQPPIKRSPSAVKTHQKEVAALDRALHLADRNRPRERQAQILANAEIKAKKNANPNMPAEARKKMEGQALTNARIRTGAHKDRIKITPEQWNAIQEGAVSNDKLTRILRNADMDEVKKLATPRTKLLMTSAKTARANRMLAAGYTRAEVAAALGVSLTTLDVATSGGG